MDVGATEKERQLINLFPVSEQSVLTAFRELNPQEEKSLLRENSPNVLADLERVLEPYTEENAKQMLWGALISYRTLREEAKLKGVVLPMLTEEFIEDYDEQKESEAEQSRIEAFRDRKLSGMEAGRAFRRRDIVTFRNLEPEFSSIAERKLSAQPNWLPEEDLRYAGIISQYLLFRAGFSNPKNFQDKYSSKRTLD